MSVERCALCGVYVPEGRQVCPVCEAITTRDGEAATKALCEMLPAEHGEILKAMFERVPVMHDGIKYGCISAFTIRTRYSHLVAMKKPYISQVELMSVRARSVLIAPPKDVIILWEEKQ